MFRTLNRKFIFGTIARVTPTFIVPIFHERNKNDEILLTDSDYEAQQTGWDRLRAMYRRNEFDEYSVELHNVVQESLCGFFIGASLGGFIKSRDAYLNFIQNNQATIFNSTFEAKKKLQDYVTISFAKGAYHWGWRLGIFTGIFSLLVTSISVYRNRSSLSDYIVGGSLTGAIYKANLGPTAMLVGAGVGGVLSALGGILILGLLKITGLSMDDIRKSLYKIKETRQQLMDEAIEKSAKEKNDQLTMHHDIIVKEKGVQKVEDLP